MNESINQSFNVRSTTFARDAVYVKVSGLDILDHSEHVEVFLNSNVDVLVTLLACSMLIFWSFNIVTVARQLCCGFVTVYRWVV
jgi:hypothetical protein